MIAVIWSFVSGKLIKLAALALRNPWPFALAAVLAVAWWQWNGKQHVKADLRKTRTSLAGEKSARAADRYEWKRQQAQIEAQRDAAERKSKEISTDAQKHHEALVADNTGLRDYIAARRVRGQAALPVNTGSQDNGAAVPESPATNVAVLTDEATLTACKANGDYAKASYDWASGLVAAGLVEFDKGN